MTNKPLYNIRERMRVDRLHKIFVTTALLRSRTILFKGKRSNDDDGNVFRFFKGFDSPANFEAVHPRQRCIEDNQMGEVYLCRNEPFYAITRFEDTITNVAKDRGVIQTTIRLIFDYQYGLLHAAIAGGRMSTY
jgi:hypothetical protein